MIPEVRALSGRPSVIRIPHQIDVPITPRVRRLIDTESFQRLSRISQLGLVKFVYPGATHTRFEHSLGVYRNALLFVLRMSQFEDFSAVFDDSQIESVVVAALLHDLGHWPYCHPIEDMALDGVAKHESIATELICGGEVGELLIADWSVSRDLVCRLIQGRPADAQERLLCSIISGPIDIDKLDYLYRDSLHCGVPYGMNFDAPRLVNAVGLNEAKNGIAISSKGKTAAEMMVFARYVMFSEVYWHHAVRSATAMFQRHFFRWFQDRDNVCTSAFLLGLDDRTIVNVLDSESDLFNGLFGTKRCLYKRLLDYNASRNKFVFERIAHQKYEVLYSIGNQLREFVSAQTGICIGEDDLIVDAPPPGLEVQFRVEVNDETTHDSLENISPVVKALAEQQFDHFVKRVRIFAHPRIHASIDKSRLEKHLLEIL